jgi:hypothetical protein
MFFLESNLVVTRVAVKEGEQDAASRRVNDLVDAWERERILWAMFVEISIIHTHSPFIIFFKTSIELANHSGWYSSLIKPTVSSFASSFLMASLLSGRSVIVVASSEWL